MSSTQEFWVHNSRSLSRNLLWNIWEICESNPPCWTLFMHIHTTATWRREHKKVPTAACSFEFHSFLAELCVHLETLDLLWQQLKTFPSNLINAFGIGSFSAFPQDGSMYANYVEHETTRNYVGTHDVKEFCSAFFISPSRHKLLRENIANSFILH